MHLHQFKRVDSIGLFGVAVLDDFVACLRNDLSVLYDLFFVCPKENESKRNEEESSNKFSDAESFAIVFVFDNHRV